MEVVLLLVAVLGVALIVVPRLKRRPARRVAVAQRVAAPVATWTADDEPSQRFRASADFEPALPSVARWRAAAAADEWDDDLGWEGPPSEPALPVPAPTEDAHGHATPAGTAAPGADDHTALAGHAAPNGSAALGGHAADNVGAA